MSESQTAPPAIDPIQSAPPPPPISVTVISNAPSWPVPEIIPTLISDRQFAHRLRNMGLITQAEAVAFCATATMPAAMRAIVDALPTQQMRDDAELLISGATVFERDHPFASLIGAGFGWTPAQLDDFWKEAAKL